MAALLARAAPPAAFIKPDITAPGVQILAGHTPTPASIHRRASRRATSRPSPARRCRAPTSPARRSCSTGCTPTWTPGQIKSALMTTATTEVVKEDLVTPADPFDMGAGRVDLHVAGTAPAHVRRDRSPVLRPRQRPAHGVHLNIPSINAPVMPGPGDHRSPRTYRPEPALRGQRHPAGHHQRPRRFSVGPASRRRLRHDHLRRQTGVQHFGEVRHRADAGFRAAHAPAGRLRPGAGRRRPGQDVPPGDHRPGRHHRVRRHRAEQLVQPAWSISPPSPTTTSASAGWPRPPRQGRSSCSGHLHGGRPATGAGRGPGAGPAGFLPLDDFGITPVAVGDEEIVNFNVPPFVYAGQECRRSA